MSTSAKVTVSFPIHINRNFERGGEGFFDGDSKLSGIAYGSDGQIRAKLKAQAEEQVAKALRLEYETRGRVIGCTDGTVLMVRFKYDSWGYAIYGAGREHGGAVLTGDSGFNETVEAAKRHALGSYGGVAWENSF